MSMTSHELIVAAWFATFCFWIVGALTTKRTVKRYSGAARVFQTGLLVAGYLLVFDPQARLGFLGWRFVPHTEAVSWIGFGMTLAGLLFAVWARVVLGRNWSSAVTVKEGHQLMRRGPYAMVRHPLYTGLLFALLGTAVAVGEVRALVGLALAVTSWRLKSLLEERLLTEQFGAEYTRYKHEVKALIPFIW